MLCIHCSVCVSLYNLKFFGTLERLLDHVRIVYGYGGVRTVTIAELSKYGNVKVCAGIRINSPLYRLMVVNTGIR